LSNHALPIPSGIGSGLWFADHNDAMEDTMSTRAYGILAGTAALTLAALACATPAHALSMHECSVKYKAAQSSGTVQGMEWRDFRKAECGPGAAAAVTPPAKPATTGAATPATTPAKPSATSAALGNAVFPSAVSPKYANERAGRARMHTCLDQYKANKAANGNGGLRWIEKGGGYYSQCNRQLSQR
jgi:hypothetical protein